jgi:polyferredoxin
MLLRARVWVYTAILGLALAGIVYGLSSLSAIDLKVLHERAPLFVQLSDGSIQNKYTIKLLNKTNDDLRVNISAQSPVPIQLVGAEEPVVSKHGEVTPAMVFVKVKKADLQSESIPVTFYATATSAAGTELSTQRESAFFGPRR